MLQVGLYTAPAPSGTLILDLSPRASNVVLTNGEHGFVSLTCFVKMALWEAFMLYDRPGIPHVQATEFGVSAYEGRLEDVAIVAGGVRLTALGYWRALSDVAYHALWSTTRVSDWEILRFEDDSTVYKDRYSIDNNNRLYITASKGATLGNTGVGNKAAMWGYRGGPSVGFRQIVACSFSYDLTAPVNWKGYLQSADSSWVRGTVQWSLAGNGATQTGTQTLTFTGTDRLVFLLRFEAADAAVAAETGGIYLKITNLRVATTTSAAIYADEIAGALAAYVNGQNPAQISASAALIKSPTVDLTDEIYDSAWPADILDRLAGLGDNSSPPKLYETGVWENQLLTFQQRGLTARTWYVDISSLELERTIAQLYNSTWANYQDANGRSLRTASALDSDSVARYGLTRRRAVNASTTNSTLATTIRDVAIQDGKDPRPRIAIAFGPRVYDAAGSAYPLWMVRAWDTMVIRNLPATLSTQLDRIRQFRTIEARYEADKNLLTVTPEQFTPSLAVLTARNAAGIKR